MRLFIAINLSKDQIDETKRVQSEFDSLVNGSKVSEFHITLKFIGDVEEKVLPSIIDALSKVKIEEISIILSKIGVFPNKDYPKVLWVGLEDDKNLLTLEKDILNAISFLNLKEDHSFHPHITLHRVKNLKDKQSFQKKIEKTEIKKIASKTASFSLYKSTLTPYGPIYSVVKDFKIS